MVSRNFECVDRLVETDSFVTSCSSPYHYFHSISANYSWNESLSQISQPLYTDVLQMHHLRFPTPPNTPPKEPVLLEGIGPKLKYGLHQRTRSVIQKVGPCRELCDHTFYNSVNENGRDRNRSCNNISNDYICCWIHCKRNFETLENLAAHVNKVHATVSVEDGLYYCRWEGCGRYNRGFNARYKMLVHVRTHTKEKPHHCHLCNKSFSRAENLKIHIRSHSGEKPYICTYEGCQKAYSNSSDRFKHTRTHSMEKPYLCKVPGCQKRYTDPSSLRKHIKTFKHSEQLIDSNFLTNVSHVSQHYDEQDPPKGRSETDEYGFCSQTIKKNEDKYLINSAGYFGFFVENLDSNSNVEDKQINFHSWNPDNAHFNPHNLLHKADPILQKELPLDLRMKRVL